MTRRLVFFRRRELNWINNILGSLPPSLTPEALFRQHDSIPRNRKIAETFFYAGLIERWGSGTTRMISELMTAGLPPPKFESEAGHFRVTFYRKPKTKEHFKAMALNERQQLVMSYIKDHGSISNAEYQILAKVSKRTSTRELNELQSKGILIVEGKGRNTKYLLKGL